MSARIDCRRVALVAATAIEAAALREALPRARIYQVGVALSKLPKAGLGPVEGLLSCGLAGGLTDLHPSGAVVVPPEVRRPDGTTLRCDPELVDALTWAARSLGFEPLCAPLLTHDGIVRGAQRAVWAEAGYAAVDMETGLLQGSRIAAVRVILDTPRRELSADWLNPGRALRDPRNWPQALWLAYAAPRYARRAAAIVARACSER